MIVIKIKAVATKLKRQIMSIYIYLFVFSNIVAVVSCRRMLEAIYLKQEQ